jgi:predicted hotdog family 3-hydroxylacyl-ACP dehydratase
LAYRRPPPLGLIVVNYPPLAETLPHEPPMVLLDRILHSDSSRTECTVKIQRDSPFLKGNGVSCIIALEYMAQCIAVRAGLEALERCEKPEPGFLIGCRKMEFHVAEFPLGSDLIVTTEKSLSVAGFGHFHCEIRNQDQIIAAGVLSVATFSSQNTDSNGS